MVVMIHGLQLEKFYQEVIWQMIQPCQEGRLQVA